jgi:hypothetical protein
MKKIKEKYELAKSAKVGEKCICPSCGTQFEKTNYQHAFCKSKKGTKCKDKYWNTVTPEKRNNTTRISPANAAFSCMQYEIRNAQPKRDNRPIWEKMGVWHDDDWHEHDGGSGGV